MIDKKEDNIRSESYYPDSNYYLDQENTPKETLLPQNQMSNSSKFEWPNSYWFIAERTNGRLAMIGFMAVIINYTLFGWIAYPILLMNNSNFDKNGVDESGSHWLQYGAFVVTAFAICFGWAFFNDVSFQHFAVKIFTFSNCNGYNPGS